MSQVGASMAEHMMRTPTGTLSKQWPEPQRFPQFLDQFGKMMSEDYDWSADIAKLPMPVLPVFADNDSASQMDIAEFCALPGGGVQEPDWLNTQLSTSRLAVVPSDSHRTGPSRPCEINVQTAAATRADANRARLEAEQQNLTAQPARAEADAARVAADAERQRAEEARQTAEAQAQQAQAVAAQSQQERDAMRQQLRQQLNLVLETRETARGLIVNVSDVRFDTGKATLKSGARQRLARVAGILLPHPDLHIQVEGHTDDVGAADYNQ